MAPPSNSFIVGVLERLRGYCDEPNLLAKYKDPYLLSNIVKPSMVEVVGSVNNSSQALVVNRWSFTTVAGTAAYGLPPTVGGVLRLVQTDANGNVMHDFVPRGLYNMDGRGWAIEGNEIVFDPAPSGALTYTIWYITTAAVEPMYAATGHLESGSKTRLILDTAPSLGTLDQRELAYVGCVVRIFSSATVSNVVEERVVVDHRLDSNNNWYVDFRRDLTHHPAGATSVEYEVVPLTLEAFKEAVAVSAALKMGTYLDFSGKRLNALRVQYRKAYKALMDSLANVQERMPKRFDRDTIDNHQPTAIWGV